jgi:translation elongation factor EF-1alpha
MAENATCKEIEICMTNGACYRHIIRINKKDVSEYSEQCLKDCLSGVDKPFMEKFIDIETKTERAWLYISAISSINLIY